MSDLYVHRDALAGRWDHRHENFVALGRYLVLNANVIRANGGLSFDEGMIGLPQPSAILATDEHVARLPPLAYGPHAGLSPEPGEDWAGYCHRTFGSHDDRVLLVWLQSPMWRKTDPSPEGAALRIAYMLDYGVPHDCVEIAMGQAYSDYDSSGFLWERLDLLPPAYTDGDYPIRRRKRPEWIGAVELARRRAETDAGYLIPPGEVPFSAGLPSERIRALAERVGPLPASYNDFLLLSGRRISTSWKGPYADQLEAIDRCARERIFARERDEDDPVPRDAIFIGLQDGRHPEFILSGKRSDSPVFVFNADDGRVTEVAFSVFTWIKAFMQTIDTRAMTPDDPALAVGALDRGKADRSLFRVIRNLFR